MKLFHVPQGTEVEVVKGTLLEPASIVRTHVTAKANTFELEEIVADPIGNRTRDPNVGNPFGAAIANEWGGTVYERVARAGRYAFERDGWTLMVAVSKVEVW